MRLNGGLLSEGTSEWVRLGFEQKNAYIQI